MAGPREHVEDLDVIRHLDDINVEYNFNYDIKEEQRTSIVGIVKKQDILAVLPTGFGKTFCIIAPILILNKSQRTLNLLLENCPGHLTQSLVENDVIKKLMQKLAESLPSLGDIEMQIACTEALARLVTKSKRPAYAAEWFPEKKFAFAFLEIQDLNFETDCRKFLNFVNETCGGKKRLLQPPHENLPDFWVDFNSAGKSVTMYDKEMQSTSKNLHKDGEKEKGIEKQKGTNAVTKSAEEPKPSTSNEDSKKTKSSSKSQDLAPNIAKEHQEINTKQDDKNTVPEPDDESNSQTTGRRTRGGKRKKKAASSSQESQEGNDNKGGRQTRSSKKFKLYSADNIMLLPDSQSSQETGRRRSKRGKKGQEQEQKEGQKEIASPFDEKELVVKTKTKAQDRRNVQQKKPMSDSSQNLNEADSTMLLPDSQSNQETGRQRSTRGKKEQEEEEQQEITLPGKPDKKEPVVKTKHRRNGQQKKPMSDSCQDLDEDLVIPSSMPATQDGSDGDIIPLSFCPIQHHLIATARRRIEQTGSTNTSICQSSSLSTITEESTQSRKSTFTMSTGINKGQTVTQRSKDHTSNPLSPVNEECNMKKNESKKTRSKKSPPNDKTAVKSRQSQIPQLDDKETDVTKKTGRCANKSLIKQSSKPMGKETIHKDPYLFTDTESVKSLEITSIQNTAKQQSGRKRNNKQVSDGRKATKGRGSQVSTQSFSPELSQDSPYLSQNDFKSPIKLSGVKTKQGKGKKTTKTDRRGNENVQSNNSQDEECLSDVEIMRDANASMSSVKDNVTTGSPRDDGDEVYKLSGNIAAKLLQNKAELEKILKSSDKKLQQKKAKLCKENGTRSKQSSTHSNETSPGKEDKTSRSKICTGGNNRDVNKSKKQSKSTNAFNSFAKPKFDPALLKFPTRVGPIPTPDALEEDSKKMKKKSTPKQSTTKPFSWDESDEEECNRGTEEFQPTGQNFERNSSMLTQRKDQPDTDQAEFNHLDGHSDNEGIDEDSDDGDQVKTQKSGRSGKDKTDVPESTKSKKGCSKGKQKQGKVNQDRDEGIHLQESIKQQEEVNASRRKPKRAAKKASRDEYMEEESVDEEVHQSDDKLTDIKKTKHVTKQKKQKGKKDFTEESDNDERQGNHRIESRKQTIKPQEKNKNKVINKVQEKARKTQKGYSSEEFDIQDIQDELLSDDETQRMPTKERQLKRKSTEQPSTKSARSKQQARVSNDKGQQKAHKSSKRKFSSQIEDAESDENREQSAEEDNDKEDRMTVTSVDSFHSLCKKLLEKSGGGIGATRTRRHIPRVNYKDPDNSEIDLSVSGSSEASASQTSPKNVSKLSKKEIELTSPASSKRSSSKSVDSQSVITNRSWLVDKPKLKTAAPPLPKKPKRQLEESDEEDDAYLFQDDEIVQDVSPQKAKKRTKTVSNRRQKKKLEEHTEKGFYDLGTKATPALIKKPKRPWEQSDEEDDAYLYYDSEEEQHMAQQKAKKSDHQSNKKKTNKTVSNKRQKKQQENDEEDEFYEIETKAPLALPKKPKRPQTQSDDDDDVYQYYYREEKLSPRETSDQPRNNNKTKKINSSKRQKKQQLENVEEEIDDIEMIRSQQFRHNATPISSALLDYTPRCDIDVYPMTPASMLQEDNNEDAEIQLSQLSLVITPRIQKTPSSSRTPKVLSFEDKVASDQDEDDGLLVSGPAKVPRPTKSALKRKYPDMYEESNDETSTSDKEKDSQQELELSQGQGILKPKNLFRTSFTTALQTKRRSLVLEDECDDIVVAEEAEINDGMSSFHSSSYDPDSTMLQMTNMMKIVGKNIKEKMRKKETNAQKLTERTIKTAQKQVARLWSSQHKARRNAQEEFQDKLLTEIVGLESDLSEMEHSLNKSQALLQQHQCKVSTTLLNQRNAQEEFQDKLLTEIVGLESDLSEMEQSLNKSQALLQQHQCKVSTTLLNHVKKVHKRENDYRTEGEALEVQLGQHLVRNVKVLLKQGLIDMQKKMVQDVQHHEIQSRKRSLQSFLS